MTIDTLPSTTIPMVLHARTLRGSGGGPDKTILRSARYVDPRRLRLGAVYIRPRGDTRFGAIREQARQWDCPLWEIGESGPVDPRTVWSLVQLCRRQRVAIWHAHDYKTDVLGLVVRRFWPMKLVSTVHGFTRETLRTRLYYHVDNMVLRYYDHVIAVSPPLVNHCRRYGVAGDKITYIANAIDAAEFRRTQTVLQARAELGLAQDRLIIGVVGRLSPEKGPDRAIRTLAQLKGKHQTAQLLLIGEGSQRNELVELVRKLELSHDVKFLGWQPQPLRYYEAMDVLLLPSRTEGLPNVVLEAMAMQVPVAASDVGGVQDLLDDGSCGVILNEDERAWPNHLAPLLVSPPRRAELARQGRTRIRQHYTFKMRMAKVVAVYEKLLHIPSQSCLGAHRRAA